MNGRKQGGIELKMGYCRDGEIRGDRVVMMKGCAKEKQNCKK